LKVLVMQHLPCKGYHDHLKGNHPSLMSAWWGMPELDPAVAWSTLV